MLASLWRIGIGIGIGIQFDVCVLDTPLAKARHCTANVDRIERCDE
jgi:hypothetical protein